MRVEREVYVFECGEALFIEKALTSLRTAVSVDVPTLHLCVMCTLSLLHVTLRSLVVGTKGFDNVIRDFPVTIPPSSPQLFARVFLGLLIPVPDSST
ncbi:hypothetical protein F2P81_001005 [Scophthalmus maximus]|uniref:Uncharacterized protein n=1 Tax=Scophthalmus maximus TaxID=52904 RepID=A0A6A4TZB2_SCOMX|nr:hypothetical protein F2P81_001005 [Scophthalmus maximus]